MRRDRREARVLRDAAGTVREGDPALARLLTEVAKRVASGAWRERDPVRKAALTVAQWVTTREGAR